MDLLGWAAILLVVGLILAMLEIFVPSGGVLGFLSVTSLIAALVMAFRHSPWSGLGFLGLAVFAVPAGLVFALQLWPKTPMGRRILLPLLSLRATAVDAASGDRARACRPVRFGSTPRAPDCPRPPRGLGSRAG